jgi:hypothetical protein
VTNELSRRATVRSAAWAMPAVVAATPAVAALTAPLTLTTSACKVPGGPSDTYKGYVFEIVVTTPGARRTPSQ